jgi:uncharacterized protein YycO
MKFGDVILFQPTSFHGKIIAWVDGSPYSHAAIYLGKDSGVDVFIESHEKKSGVVITQLEDWRNYVVLRPVKPMKHRTRKELLSKLGKGYDFSMIGWILLAKIFRKDRSTNDDNLLICSELVDWFYYYAIGGKKICTPKTIATCDKFNII